MIRSSSQPHVQVGIGTTLPLGVPTILPYNPDLAQSSFHLSVLLKKQLDGKQFANDSKAPKASGPGLRCPTRICCVQGGDSWYTIGTDA